MSFSLVVKVSTIAIILRIAFAYVDTRDSPCLSQDLQDTISREYVSWSGVIRIEMHCTEGSDWPLNKPSLGFFSCKPDGSPWDPPIFPDCNDKVLPKVLFANFAVRVSPTQCADITDVTPNGTSMVVTSKKNTTQVPLCESGSAINNCRVVEAHVVCHPKIKKKQDRWEKLNLTHPHIFIRLEFSYNTYDTYPVLNESLQEVENQLRSRFRDMLGSVSEVSSALKAKCSSSTTAVITEEDKLACRGCSLGHYFDGKSRSCKLCDPGYYNDQPQQKTCKMCPALRNMSNKTIWQTVKKHAPDGAYAIVLCPTLIRDQNGNIIVKMPPSQPPVFSGWLPYKGSSTSNSAAASLSVTTLLCCCIIALAWT